MKLEWVEQLVNKCLDEPGMTDKYIDEALEGIDSSKCLAMINEYSEEPLVIDSGSSSWDEVLRARAREILDNLHQTRNIQ